MENKSFAIEGIIYFITNMFCCKVPLNIWFIVYCTIKEYEDNRWIILRAKDRILGLKLGQSEEDKKAQLLAEKQKEKDKQLKENILSDFLSRSNKW